GRAHAPDGEVEQTFVPRANLTQLHGAVVAIAFGQGMDGAFGSAGTQDAQRGGFWRIKGFGPELVNHRALPAREQADAEGRRHDAVEIGQQRGDRQIEIDVLADSETGDDIERHFADDTQRTEADDDAGEIRVAAVIVR